nr:MAG TPA: N-acetylmuramoyl-L-alanine amidase [Caudoviricetes sp.]
MNIIKAFGTTNTDYYSKTLQKKYIVLHYTAGTRSVKGSARNVASMFKSGSVGGSADFIVDDAEIVQYNSDISHRACWAVGGKKYTSMTTSEGGKYYNICTNSNSISIEMCSNKVNTKKLGATDTDWYLTEATINNAVELTKYLMKQYNIPVENVIMHHQVTGKICPNPWCVNQSRLSKWQDFKSRLEEKVVKQNIKINGKIKTVDAINKDGFTYVKIRDLSELLNIGYDKETKLISVGVK